MSILITGGAGFIGRHTVKLLESAGYDLVILDNLSTGQREGLQHGTFVQGDISDESLVRSTLREHAVSAVIHLAGSSHVSESLRQPNLYFINNVGATLTLLNAMMSEGVLQFVFASTCAVYGDQTSETIAEDIPPVPLSPYGESKLQIERALRWFSDAFSLRWAVLRYFNVAGSQAGLCEDIKTSNRIIPRSINSALNSVPISVFGTGFQTPDGSAVRDYVHVSDVSRANLDALRFIQSGRSGAILNIASGVGVSVLEIVRQVTGQTSRKVIYDTHPARPGDPARVVADISAAKDTLMWAPRESDLSTLITSVIHSKSNR
jgi:UDP-arabinose 4-epimerase